jgi:hypothetical protein
MTNEQPGTSKTRYETYDDNEVQRKKKKKAKCECAFQDEWMKRSEYKSLKGEQNYSTVFCV